MSAGEHRWRQSTALRALHSACCFGQSRCSGCGLSLAMCHEVTPAGHLKKLAAEQNAS